MRLNFKFLQTDGVPLTADLMDVVQQAYAIFNVIGDVAGNLTILKGCEVTGTLVAPGIVVINGDVLFFEGGSIVQNVFINQENISKVFKNQQSKILIEKKTVKFGNASEVYPWSGFVRIETLRQISETLSNKAEKSTVLALLERVMKLEIKTAPIINGGVFWAFGKPADQIPFGWKECLDKRGKTLVGQDPNDFDFSVLGGNYGTKTHTLDTNELPQHNFTFQFGKEKVGTGNQNSLSANGGSSFTATSSTIGAGQSHNNVQPSNIVLFIEPNFQ